MEDCSLGQRTTSFKSSSEWRLLLSSTDDNYLSFHNFKENGEFFFHVKQKISSFLKRLLLKLSTEGRFFACVNFTKAALRRARLFQELLAYIR